MTKKFNEAEDTIEEQDAADEAQGSARISMEKTFANVYLRGPICDAHIDPIIEFIIGANTDPENELEVINMFIDSEGGDLTSALKLIDTFALSSIPVRTIGWGTVASAGLMIFMSGTERIISDNASILSHQGTFHAERFSVKLDDLGSHQREFENITHRVYRLYMNVTGKPKAYIKKHLLTHSDEYLNAEEAIRHGLADSYLQDQTGFDWLSVVPWSDVESVDTV